jgi:hypothetical protein
MEMSKMKRRDEPAPVVAPIEAVCEPADDGGLIVRNARGLAPYPNADRPADDVICLEFVRS